jgi:MFS family permease
LSKERAFWAIYISVAISYLGVGLVAPLISIVLAEHGADSVIVGLVGTTMFAAFTLASFPLGALIDRLGPKPILVLGLAVYGLSLLAFAFISSTGLFFLVRGIEGIGGAAISVATETMISQLSGPQERAKRMSYYALSVGLGWAAGPLAGALLFNLQAGLPFYASCGFSLLAAAAVLAFVPKTAGGDHHVEELAKPLSMALLMPISAGALYGYLMSSLVTLFPLYLKHLNVSETKMGSVITAVIVGTIVSQIPLGHAADRYGKRKVLLVCAILVCGVFVAMPQSTDWQNFMITGAMLGAVAGSFYPIGLSIIGEIVSRERLGAATSLFTLVFGIGSLTGPAVSGFAMTHFGDKWLFYLPAILTAAFCVEAILLYSRTKRRRKSNANDQPAGNDS